MPNVYGSQDPSAQGAYGAQGPLTGGSPQRKKQVQQTALTGQQASATTPTFSPQTGSTAPPGSGPAFSSPVTSTGQPAPPAPPQDITRSTVAQTFPGPDQTESDAAIHTQVMHILQNPDLYNPQQIAAMKEGQKETALQTSKDAPTQLQQSAASRGVGLPVADLRRNADTTQSNLLGLYRDTDLQTTQANRAASIAALQAASGLSNDQVTRQSNIYNTNLGGLVAQNNIWNQQGQLGLGNATLQANINQNAVQNDLQNQNLTYQMLMGKLGYGLDLAKLKLQGGQSILDFISGLGK